MDCQAEGSLGVLVYSSHDPTYSFFPKFKNQEIDKDEKTARVYLPDSIHFSI